jgi:hypothetical protein
MRGDLVTDIAIQRISTVKMDVAKVEIPNSDIARKKFLKELSSFSEIIIPTTFLKIILEQSLL